MGGVVAVLSDIFFGGLQAATKIKETERKKREMGDFIEATFRT